jgi:hypothetical protein
LRGPGSLPQGPQGESQCPQDIAILPAGGYAGFSFFRFFRFFSL